jgi:hypothetical protein
MPSRITIASRAPAAIVSGQPHAEQACVQSGVGAQLPQPHPGGVGEQHPHQRDVGQQLDDLVRDLRIYDLCSLRQQEADADEHDGRAQVRRPSRTENRRTPPGPPASRHPRPCSPPVRGLDQLGADLGPVTRSGPRLSARPRPWRRRKRSR